MANSSRMGIFLAMAEDWHFGQIDDSDEEEEEKPLAKDEVKEEVKM